MASSASIISPPTENPSNSDMDIGSEDTEYEEVEVEVEVEEEFEVEVEIEDQGNEIGEDLTPIRQENGQDGNQTMELEEKAHIKSGYVSQGKPVPTSLTDISTKQKIAADVNISQSSEKEELHVNGERTNPKAPFYDSGEPNHEKRTPIGDFTTGVVVPGTFWQKDNAILPLMAETNRISVEAVPNLRQISPRLPVPLTRFSDHPSTGALDRENKKLKIACEFHAKGWCIRANSCRFLHVNDGSQAVTRSDVLEREESSSGCIPSQQSGENPKLNCETEKLVLHKDYMIESAPLQAGRGSFGHNLYLDKYSYNSAPFGEGNLNENSSIYRGNFSGGPFTSHDNHHKTRISSGTTLEESICKKSEIVRSDPRSAELPYTHPRDPLSFGSSSWNTNAFGTQNLLQRGLELRASVSSSLQQSISPVPRSEPKSLSQDHIIGDTEPGKYKPMYADWEPSVSFRPSHAITRNLLLKENLYDPIRDSIIVQGNVTAGQVKFSNSDEGSSVKNINMQSNNSVEEEKHLDLVHVGDTPKDNILSSSCDEKVTFDEPAQKATPGIGGSGRNDETGLEFKRDDQLLSESKAFKYFQFALIEFVKELVKPTWHEGRLSKDAHKMIVKRSVDKVLGTLQPHQIPRTGESIKSYLSSSQPKLEKLVEGYIEKYGRS